MRSSCDDLYSLRVKPLLHSVEEINRVVSAWEVGPNEVAQVLTGQNAREEHVKSMASGKRALHFATHGFFLNGACETSGEAGSLLKQFREENPLLQSGLLFAGANHHGAASDSLGLDDGILSAYEVASLDLSGVQSVVMSACESALGTIRQNEGMHGLRRAFESAGAETIVGALWPVPDLLSADMATVIYAKSSSTPLPERMQAMANKSREKLRALGIPEHPLLWAGFVSYGDWRN
jgi:CHAT domain-containing protein